MIAHREDNPCFLNGAIIWKSLRVRRVFDEANRTLIHITHAQEVQQGSAKNVDLDRAAVSGRALSSTFLDGRAEFHLQSFVPVKN